MTRQLIGRHQLPEGVNEKVGLCDPAGGVWLGSRMNEAPPRPKANPRPNVFSFVRQSRRSKEINQVSITYTYWFSLFVVYIFYKSFTSFVILTYFPCLVFNSMEHFNAFKLYWPRIRDQQFHTQLAVFQTWPCRALIQMPGCCFSGLKPTVWGKNISRWGGCRGFSAWRSAAVQQKASWHLPLFWMFYFYGFCCEACTHKQLEVTVSVGQQRWGMSVDPSDLFKNLARRFGFRCFVWQGCWNPKFNKGLSEYFIIFKFPMELQCIGKSQKHTLWRNLKGTA